MMVSNRNLLFQGSIFRGYVSLPEGTGLHFSQSTERGELFIFEFQSSSLLCAKGGQMVAWQGFTTHHASDAWQQKIIPNGGLMVIYYGLK